MKRELLALSAFTDGEDDIVRKDHTCSKSVQGMKFYILNLEEGEGGEESNRHRPIM